jgi:hypothetical protein
MPRTITVPTYVKKGLQFLIAEIEILGKKRKNVKIQFSCYGKACIKNRITMYPHSFGCTDPLCRMRSPFDTNANPMDSF